MKYVITDSSKNLTLYHESICSSPILSVKPVTLKDLAKDVIVSYNASIGCIEPIVEINSATGSIFIEKILREGKVTFCPKESICKKTNIEILNNINLIRSNDTKKEFDNSKDKKIMELKEMLCEYEKILDDYKLYDDIKILSKALEILDKKDFKYHLSNCDEYKTLWFDEKRSSLERRFLDKLFDGKKLDPAYLLSDKANKKVNASAKKCYGVYNEVEQVNLDIAKNKYKFGDVEILYTSDEILPYMRAIFGENGIKLNVISSYTAMGNPYVKLVKDILDFANGNFIYEDLKKVCFNRLLKVENVEFEFLKAISWGIGFGKDQYNKVNDKDKTEFRDFLIDIIKVFDVEKYDAKLVYQNVLSFADKYTGDSKEKNTMKERLSALSDTFKYAPLFETLNDAIEFILEEYEALSLCDEETNDTISARKLDGFFISNRKHVYIIGLSSRHYDVSNTESPVLSDADRTLYFDLDKGSVSLKSDAPKESEEAIMKTIRNLSAETLAISMSFYSTLEFMPLSESNLYRKLVGAFSIKEDIISSYENIVDEDYKFDVKRLLNSVSLDKKEFSKGNKDKEGNFDITFSKSALDNFINCALSYHYEKESKINKEEYTSPKEDEWLESKDKGSFAHRVLEIYANECLIDKKVGADINLDKINQIIDTVFVETTGDHPVDSEGIANNFVSECKNKIIVYLKRLHQELSSKGNKWKVLATEFKFGFNESDKFIKTYSINGKKIPIKYLGVIDRVDGYKGSDGKLHVRLVDYKTGQKRFFDSADTTQQDIYSLYYNDKNVVEEFRYEFIFDDIERDGDGVIIVNKDELFDPIEHFNLKDKLYEVFINRNYDVDNIDDSKDLCKNCKYIDICLKKVK